MSARGRGLIPWGLVWSGLVCLLAWGCAGKPEQAGLEKPEGDYESADAANVAVFLEQYVEAWNGDDEKRVLRLYADDARLAPLMVQDRRAIGKKDLAGQLGFMLKARARMGLRLSLEAPPEITVRGETAEARALMRADYEQDGRPTTATLEYRFNLRRINYFWKVALERYQGASKNQGQGTAKDARTGNAPAKGGAVKSGTASGRKGATTRTDQSGQTGQSGAGEAPESGDQPKPLIPPGKPKPIIQMN